jgi:cephalosporin hydroxylase
MGKAMTANPHALDIADRPNGVRVQMDAATGEMVLTYTPANEPLTLTAKVRVDPAALTELCAAGAMLDAARQAELTARLMHLPKRAAWPARTLGQRIERVLEWLVTSKENTNYTYDLTPLNLAHLAATIAVIAARPVAEIEAYMKEPASDAELIRHYADTVAALTPDLAAVADPVARWARRLGWYALVRAAKPRTIVETGVDKGHGALLLCAALRRNAAEGRSGGYIGTDINPMAGYLLRPPYAEYGGLMIGDSIQSLRKLSRPIDVFINDSDHSADYESAEYQTIAPLLHARSVVIGDNSHVTDRLARFAADTGRKFLFFSEVPHAHWYPGAGNGFAFT